MGRGTDMEARTFGSEEEGFAVGPGAATGTLHIRMWGFWSVETAEKFAGVVLAACASGSGSVITIDAAALKPLRDAGQRAVGGLLAALPTYKVKRVIVTQAGALTRLQLLRLVKEVASQDLVLFGH